jgi:adenylylsulfate kinase-like enzyme
MASPRMVLVTGALGSGKTTLGRHLADALSVPHVNKDRIREGLWLTDPSTARDGDRIWGIWMSSVRLLLAAGVSVVVDQTLYRGKSEADLWSQLLPLSRTVNVHTRSPLADSAGARSYLTIRGGNQSSCFSCSPKRKAMRRYGRIPWTSAAQRSR